MYTQQANGFSSFKTPDLSIYASASGVRTRAYRRLENSGQKAQVNKACLREAKAIAKITASHNLEEMIALELRLQLTDLEKDAFSEQARKSVEQGLSDLRSGIHSYTMLKHDPEQYKEAAKGYTERNRDMKLDVPKDGMRYALSSQSTRLQNRMSLQLSAEERKLLTVRRTLLGTIRDEYSTLQQKALHDNAE